MPVSHPRVHIKDFTNSPKSKTITIPTGSIIIENIVAFLIPKRLQYMKNCISSDTAKSCYPDRYITFHEAFGNNYSLRSKHFLILKPWSRCIKKQIHCKGRLIIILICVKNPVIFYIFCTPYFSCIKPSALPWYYICLLTYIFAITDLFNHMCNKTIIKPYIFIIIWMISFNLQLWLFS